MYSLKGGAFSEDEGCILHGSQRLIVLLPIDTQWVAYSVMALKTLFVKLSHPC